MDYKVRNKIPIAAEGEENDYEKTSKIYYQRKAPAMTLPYSDTLQIQYLNRLFDNTSNCYKFFWFQAIIAKVLDGRTILTFEELINEMIADAWYMVTEYHLNLGPRDTLEEVVNYIRAATQMKPSEKKENILNYLENSYDKEVITHKRTLTMNVPYRLQAPFMDTMKGKAWDVRPARLADRINQENHLMYYFVAIDGLHSSIRIQEDWVAYIVKNQEILKGWLQYNMIRYLQKRNPSVPGIADKLCPPQERKLDKVKKYWKLILTVSPVREIYGHTELTSQDISIDHFVPWSYVAHDELWNLHPTTKSINSSKSNYLPDWDIYFPQLVQQEYASYELIWKNEAVHKAFETCAREHLNNDEIRYRIYREGLGFDEFSNTLKNVIQPVYQSAQNCGFQSWIYQRETVQNSPEVAES